MTDATSRARARVTPPRRERAVIEFFVPGKLVNPLNGSFSRSHWSRKSKWAHEWKARTIGAMRGGAMMTPRAYDAMTVAEPKRVEFLAYTGSTWDDDNLPAAIKPIRDALIGYVIDSDAPSAGHVFTYAQEINRNDRGVRVRIAPREEG